QHHRLGRWVAVEIQWRDIRGAKTVVRFEHVREFHAKGDVQQLHRRTNLRLPQAEHRIAASANPVESDFAVSEELSEFQAERVGIKRHRTLEIADREMCFEKILDRNHFFVIAELSLLISCEELFL